MSNPTPSTVVVINELGNDIGPSSAGKPRRKLERVLVKLADGQEYHLFGTAYAVNHVVSDAEIKEKVKPTVRKAKTEEKAPANPAKAAMIAALAKKLGLSAEEAAVLSS